MKLTAQSAAEFVTAHLQPKIRVDGGDVEFEKLTGSTVHLGAHAECATCPAVDECLKWWCEQEFSKAFEKNISVTIHNRIPYFEQ